MSSDSESIVPATRSRWVRRLFYAAGAIALLVLAVWVAVPPIARAQLETRLTEALGRTTTVESVEFDPLRLRLDVRNLVIADRAAQRRCSPSTSSSRTSRPLRSGSARRCSMP